MSLFNITFDSETETSQEKEHIKRNDENSIPKSNPAIKKTHKKTIRYVSDEDEVLSTPKTPPKSAPNGLLTVIVTREKKKKINGTRYYFRCFLKSNELNKLVTSKIKQKSSKNKACPLTNDNKQIFIAKAKSQSSKTIPIANGNTIHLKTPESFAVLEMNNENSEFTLIQNQFSEDPKYFNDDCQVLAQSSVDASHNIDLISNNQNPNNTNSNTSINISLNPSSNSGFSLNGQNIMNSQTNNADSSSISPPVQSASDAPFHISKSQIPRHLMVVKFILPKDQFQNLRKVHVTFLAKTDVPSPLFSLSVTSVSGYEGRYMMYSIKNAIIVDEKTHSTIITIRKTGPKQLEIDTHFDIPPLWLFGLGIASFLGKKPVH